MNLKITPIYIGFRMVGRTPANSIYVLSNYRHAIVIYAPLAVRPHSSILQRVIYNNNSTILRAIRLQ